MKTLLTAMTLAFSLTAFAQNNSGANLGQQDLPACACPRPECARPGICDSTKAQDNASVVDKRVPVSKPSGTVRGATQQ